MKRSIVVTLAVLATAALTGCASWANRDDLQVIPDTLAVGSYGPNYRITALVESSGRRFAVWVLAEDCENRYGDIWGPKKRARSALLNGDTPKDKLFTHLCATGLPLIDEMKSRVTLSRRQSATGQ